MTENGQRMDRKTLLNAFLAASLIISLTVNAMLIINWMPSAEPRISGFGIRAVNATDDNPDAWTLMTNFSVDIWGVNDDWFYTCLEWGSSEEDSTYWTSREYTSGVLLDVWAYSDNLGYARRHIVVPEQGVAEETVFSLYFYNVTI